MRKTFIATTLFLCIFALAATCSAAGSPFSDVPAKHWSYDAVNQLYQKGIVEGSNGAFEGEKTLTRFEIAKIIARAMAYSDKADQQTKALIDKLAVEYAAELNNLGVRVAKLEQNVGTVRFEGSDARIRWIDKDLNAANKSNDRLFQQRVRLAMRAQLNKDTSFYGRIMAMNNNTFGTTGNDVAQMIDANFSMKNFFGKNSQLTVGRYSLSLGQTSIFAGTVGRVDGVKITTGKDLKLMLGYGDLSALTGTINESVYAEVEYDFSKKLTASATYFEEITGRNPSQYTMAGAGLTYKPVKNFLFKGDYYKNIGYKNNQGVKPDPVLINAKVQYGDAKKTVPGSWEVGFEYLKAEPNTVSGSVTGSSLPVSDVKLYAFSFGKTLAKNIVLESWYAYDVKNSNGTPKNGASQGEKYTRIQIVYSF